MCTISNLSRDMLRSHQRSMHKENFCDKCGFKARTENILEMHLCRDRTIEHWKNPLNCEICDYEAFNKLDFDSHIHCEKCQEDFKDIDHLEQHNLFEEH